MSSPYDTSQNPGRTSFLNSRPKFLPHAITTTASQGASGAYLDEEERCWLRAPPSAGTNSVSYHAQNIQSPLHVSPAMYPYLHPPPPPVHYPSMVAQNGAAAFAVVLTNMNPLPNAIPVNSGCKYPETFERSILDEGCSYPSRSQLPIIRVTLLNPAKMCYPRATPTSVKTWPGLAGLTLRNRSRLSRSVPTSLYVSTFFLMPSD